MLKMNILITGIKVKLDRGEDLEKVLETYTKLTNDEKDTIRDYFIPKEDVDEDVIEE